MSLRGIRLRFSRGLLVQYPLGYYLALHSYHQIVGGLMTGIGSVLVDSYAVGGVLWVMLCLHVRSLPALERALAFSPSHSLTPRHAGCHAFAAVSAWHAHLFGRVGPGFEPNT